MHLFFHLYFSRLTKPGLFTKSLKSSSLHISSQDKGQWRIKKKLVSIFIPFFFFSFYDDGTRSCLFFILFLICHFMMVLLASVVLPMPAKLWDTKTLRYLLHGCLFLFFALPKFLRPVSKTSKGASSQMYSPSGSQWKMTSKLVPF